MKRRAFLALLTAGAAAVAAEQALGPMALPRLFGGDYEPSRGLWTPDLPLVAIPPPLDLASILSMQRAARVVLEHLATYLPERHERQLIVPTDIAYGFRLGETVLAADLSPAGWQATPAKGFTVVDVGPFVLDRNYAVSGGFLPRVLHDLKTDDEAYRFLDRTMLAPACALAHQIETTGWNIFAPPAHVQFGEESVIATSNRLSLALRASRHWDAERGCHELQFDILGGRA